MTNLHKFVTTFAVISCLSLGFTACSDDSDDSKPAKACDCATGANCSDLEKAGCEAMKCNCATGANCSDLEKAGCEAMKCDCATGANCSDDEKKACETKKCDCATGANCSDDEKKACELDKLIKAGEPLDNITYCHNACDDYKNCYLRDATDKDSYYCSACGVNCAAKFADFPVCDEEFGLCVAAACKDDEYAQQVDGKDDGTGVCTEECGDGYACNNDKYCDGQCLAGEYCFGEDPDDSDVVICSKCSVDCGVIFGNVCNETAGLCMATATCPVGTTPIDVGGGMGECRGGDVPFCRSEADCEMGYICKDGSCVADDGTKTFRYVRIDDVSEPCKKGSDGKCTTEDPGADIDAIVVVKNSGGAMLTASNVVGYLRADGQRGTKDKTMAADPEKALGAPDSFVDYANSSVGGKCKYYSDAAKTEYTFVSLGGQGGYLEVEMSGAIEQGDTLDVLEIGGCEIENSNSSDGKKAIGEAIKVSISASEDGTSWVEIGQKTSGTDNKGLLSFKLSNSSWFN